MFDAAVVTQELSEAPMVIAIDFHGKVDAQLILPTNYLLQRLEIRNVIYSHKMEITNPPLL